VTVIYERGALTLHVPQAETTRLMPIKVQVAAGL
jgi:hypothetical protein